MLRHRGRVKRLVETQVGGMPVHAYEVVGDPDRPLRVFLDLNFIRKGKDPSWTPEAGRPADRAGVLFLMGDADVKNGDRIEMTSGPAGTFQMDMAIDEAWRPDARHHLEVFVKEVPRQITKGTSR